MLEQVQHLNSYFRVLRKAIIDITCTMFSKGRKNVFAYKLFNLSREAHPAN